MRLEANTPLFNPQAGQFATLHFDDLDRPRPYSFARDPQLEAAGEFSVFIREVGGGGVSDWLRGALRPEPDRDRNQFQPRVNGNAAAAASLVRREHGGRVLSVTPARQGDAAGFRVRVLLAGGRVKTLFVHDGKISAPNPSVISATDQR